MHFSLIVATIKRVNELRRLFRSLAQQTYRNFDIIIVDQNADDRLVTVVTEYAQQFPITHVRSATGLSRARNVGMRYVGGDIVGFPDDDCWYDPDLLERVAGRLNAHPNWGGVSGRSVDDNGNPTNGRWDRKAGVIDPMNIWRRAISFSIFLRTSVTARHEFDDTLGVGSGTEWGAGEETDFLLRAISNQAEIYYDPGVTIRHSQAYTDNYSQTACSKARSYGMGMGRVLRKHQYPLYAVAYHLVRPLGGVLLSVTSGRFRKARFHWAVLSGRARGWGRKPSAGCLQPGLRSTQV